MVRIYVCGAADSQLRTILASDNNLSGPFPASLGQLQYLRELHLDNNELTGTMPPASPGVLWLSLPIFVTWHALTKKLAVIVALSTQVCRIACSDVGLRCNQGRFDLISTCLKMSGV